MKPFTFTHQLLRFPARRVAEISGLSIPTQRSWRRRGFLPPLEDSRHFRADVFDLAMLMVAEAIADKLPVREAVDIAGFCAQRVAVRALMHPRCWEGGTDAAFLETLQSQAMRASAARYGKQGRVLPAQHFILWADGSEVWHHSVSRAVASAKPEQLAGPTLWLDLDRMGDALAERGAPFVVVEREAA
ncbi:hypothetical protein EYE35_12660 [Cereibacter sphaeroides]|nr:hypothetical protein EYE35_12660 [Cereibacter sphaeroides]